MQNVPIQSVRGNDRNPRKLDKEKFQKLVQSIKDFPEMLEKRPLVVADGVILGGNMRHKAAIEAGLKEIPIIDASEWTDKQKEQFIIKDNLSFGEWDWDVLANEWDAAELEVWGLDVWTPEEEPAFDELIGEEKNKPATMKITFDSPEQLQQAEIEIQELLDRKYPGSYFSVSAGEV